MGKIVSYELQTYRMGTWKIDSIFDDKELALFEARRVAESRRHSAVRVVQEDYDENTNDTTNRIVYRSSSVAESNNQAAEKQRQMKRPAAARPTGGGEIMGKKAIMGAVALYLDFVNLFMMLLHLFGNRE